MEKSDLLFLNYKASKEQLSHKKSSVTPGLRKQLSLPCLTNHINHKQLFPSKSWNQLARETEEKKQKRKLNNQLKNQLEKFFEGDEILMEPSRGSRSRNNRSNKRMATEKNQSQSKSSINKKSSQSLGRHNKPVPKPLIQQSNFVPRKGVKPTHFLADLDIEDSSSDAFKSIVPQSPNQPSFVQRSTPKQTPRSQIIPSRLNSNKNAQSNYRSQYNPQYTQPDSPVDILQPLRSQSSHNYGNSEEEINQKLGAKYPEYMYNSIKSAQLALMRSQDDSSRWAPGVPSNFSRNDRGDRGDIDRDVIQDRLSHQKNVQMLKQMQKRLGCQKSEDQDQQQQQFYDIQINNVQYLQRPNQLQIIDEVDDERSFNVHKDSQDGRFRSVPLSVVEQKIQSDVQQYKVSTDKRTIRYSMDPNSIALEDSQAMKESRRKSNSLKPNVESQQQKMIRQCSSKQLLKNQQAKQQNKQQVKQEISDPQIILSQSFKKKSPSNVLQASHSSQLQKQQDYPMPAVNVFTASNHQKLNRYIPNEVFDMSPIQRSKASGIIHQPNDNSISKQFGNDWFTPKHDKKNQSIQKLSPIYDHGGNTQQFKNKTEDKSPEKNFTKPLTTQQFTSLNILSTRSPTKSFINNSQNQLSIKYPLPTNFNDKNQQHTLKVIKKSEINKLVPSSVPQLNLKEYVYQPSSNQNLLLSQKSDRLINAFKKEPLPNIDSTFSYAGNTKVDKQIADDPVKQISRKFSIDFSQLNFSPRIQYSSSLTPLNFTPTKIIQRSTTSYIPNGILKQTQISSPLDNHNTKFKTFSIDNSPLNSYRPSQLVPSTTQRNSDSLKKGKGIRLWINNYNQNSQRSKSPISERLSSIKKKINMDKMNNLQNGIFKSRSKQKDSSKIVYHSPIRVQNNPSISTKTIINGMQDSNHGTSISSPINRIQSRKQSIISPAKNIIRLGKRGSVNNLESPRRTLPGERPIQKSTQKKDQPSRSGIKLSCEFKKHKYQQKGIVKYLN